MDNATNYFETWQKAQQNLYNGFLESAKQAQAFWGQQYPPATGADGIQNLYATWSKALLNSLSGNSPDNTTLLRDSFTKMLGGSNAYTKAYDLWLPLLKAAQERAINPQAYAEYLDPARAKALIDQVFGFDQEAIKLAMEQGQKLLELYTGASQQFGKPWSDAAKTGWNAFPQFAEGRPESFIKVYHALFNAFDNTLGKAFHAPPVGKDREKIELLLRGFDDLSVYAAKTTEYQHLMYTTGLGAIEKVVEKLAEKIKSGEEIKQFDEFFDIWIDVSEQAYFKLFQTEDFSRLQGVLLMAKISQVWRRLV
ncbi:MAG: poly(R)-hydroxyalkanoic acid synthase subunit PhaE [Candidatus Methylumidiphilus sp.]